VSNKAKKLRLNKAKKLAILSVKKELFNEIHAFERCRAYFSFFKKN